MQSTGQTSTHDRSFRLMQGSAMMYGIQAPGNFASNRKHRGAPTPVQGPVAGTAIRVISDKTATRNARSEERRVGKECRAGWWEGDSEKESIEVGWEALGRKNRSKIA